MRRNVFGGFLGKPGFFLFTATIFGGAVADAFGAILPAERCPTTQAIPWQGLAGARSDFRTNRAIYQTLSAGANIQSALNSCPVGMAVKLNAGTYSLSSGITIPAGRTLKGSGATGSSASILNYTGSGGNIVNVSGGSEGGNVSITSGATKGSTSITVSSASGLSAGTYIIIKHGNYSWVTPNGIDGTCSWCSHDDPSHVMSQVDMITGVSGNTLSLEKPLYFNYPNSPFLRTIPKNEAVGIEDLQIKRAPSDGEGYNLYMVYTENCWVTNVYSTNGGSHNFRILSSYANTFEHCWLNDAANNHGSDHAYGLHLMDPNSAHLVVNSIFQNHRHSINAEGGASGCVFAYNYSFGGFNETSGFLTETFDGNHGAHPFMNLYEGNVVEKVSFDDTWGSSSHNTVFRTVIVNWSANATSSGRWAVDIEANNYTNSVVGCIIGRPGDTGTRIGSGWSTLVSYRYGATDQGGGGDNDSMSRASTYVHGSYDYIGNILQWDAGNADHNLPNSLYLASKPAWFGNLTWPPFTPTSTSWAAIDATNIPAGYRRVFGVDPPAGGGGGSSNPPSITSQPNSITNLAGTANTFSVAATGDGTLTYQWKRWGTNSIAGATSSSFTLTNCQPTTNSFFTVVVANAFGSATSSAAWIWVTNAGAGQKPVASIGATPNGGRIPLTVAFSSAGSSSPYGDPLTYSWNFGDGSTSTAANPSHTYSTSDSYSVSLGVRNTNGVTTTNILILAANAQSGLVAAWGFEEGSGSTVHDASGGNNTGSITAATWTTGKFGDGLSFGSGAIVTVPDAPPLDLTTGLTVEAWLYPESSVADWVNCVYKPYGASAICYALNGSSPSGIPSFYISDGSSQYGLFAPSTMALNTWTHLAATYNGSQLRLYVNGTQATNQATAITIVTSTDALTIGGNAFTGHNWPGLIDEVRIYGRALTQAEIQTDMNSPVFGTLPPAPVGLKVVFIPTQ